MKLKLTLIALFGWLAWVPSLVCAQSDPPTATDDLRPFSRRIYLPSDQINVLLNGNSNRVLLTNQEYEDLLAAARRKKIERAPRDGAVVSASYQAAVTDNLALVKGSLTLETFNAGITEIPLVFNGIALRSATLDGQPAALFRNAEGQIVLMIGHQAGPADAGNQPGKHQLELDMMLPVTTSAARQGMSFQLPAASAARFELTVPGNVEVKSGMSVVQRNYEANQDQTRFDLLMRPDPVNVVLSLNNRQLKDDRVVVARSVTIHKLMPSNQELHTTCSLDVIHGAIESAAFRVPAGYEIEEVLAAKLNRWEVTDGPDQQRRLILTFREAIRSSLVINVKATLGKSPVGDWQSVELTPEGVAGHVSVVGVLADIALTASSITSESVVPIEHQFLTNAIPSTMQNSAIANPVRVMGAFYSPQPDYQLAISIQQPAPELIVQTNSRLIVANRGLELSTGISLRNRFDARVGATLRLPPRWRPVSVTNEQNQPIPFDHVTHDDLNRVIMKMENRLSDQWTRVFVKAELVPDGWLEDWATTELIFPSVEIEGQTSHEGQVSVATLDDLFVSPRQRAGLDLVERESADTESVTPNSTARLSYRFRSSDYQLQLEVQRVQPVISARAYHFFALQPETTRQQIELLYTVNRAAQGSFSFELPSSTPESINIRCLEQPLKERVSRASETGRIWTVELSQPASGSIHLIIDFETPVPENESLRSLQPVVVQEVPLQSTLVAIEGSHELDTRILNPGRSVDIGEFSETEYRVSRLLLGAFTWRDPVTPISVESNRRDFYSLPAAIIQRSELVSVMAADGTLQTAARYQIATKQLPFLEIELPPEATLWALLLDGQSAKPQQQGDRLLISLTGTSCEGLRELQVVYESRVESVGLVGHIEALAPVIKLNQNPSDPTRWEAIPQVDSDWKLVLPNGYTVGRLEEGLESDPAPSPWQLLVRWTGRLGSSLNPIRAASRKQAATTDASTGWFESANETNRFEDTAEAAEMSLPQEPAGEGAQQIISGKFDLGKDFQLASPTETVEMHYGLSGEAIPTPPSINPPQTPSQAGLQQWALKSLGSLKIELDETGNTFQFRRLNGKQLETSIVHRSRLNWLSIGIAILVMALGVWMTQATALRKLGLLIGLIAVAQFAYLVWSMDPIVSYVVNPIMLAVVLVGIYFVLVSIGSRLAHRIGSWTGRLGAATTGMALFLILTTSGASAQEVVDQIDQLKQLLRDPPPAKPLQLPEDAILIPFDSNDPDGRAKADQLLIPYQHYLQLLNGAPADKESTQSTDFVISGAEYGCQLASQSDHLITGKVTIDVLVDTPVVIPLYLSGGALAQATVDNQSAKLQLLDPGDASAIQAKLPTPPGQNDATGPGALLQLSGKGRHEFRFQFQIKPLQQGGWRILKARLPVGISKKLTLITDLDPTEIRIQHAADRRTVDAIERTTIETAPGDDGTIHVQWRPATLTEQLDSSLTATSEAVFDVREDGLQLMWYLNLAFRGADRDSFSLQLPDGYLVEQVTGDNIRGWEVATDSRRLDVTLLSPAKNQEAFIVELSRRSVDVNQPLEIDAPFVKVESAALHRGTYTIRKSPILEIQSAETRFANRVDSASIQRRISDQQLAAKASPLGIERFQEFEFLATPFLIKLAIRPAPQQWTVANQALLRLGQSRASLEMKFNVDITGRPIHQFSFEIPLEFEIERLTAGINETWITETKPDHQLITLFFPAGVADPLTILFEGQQIDYVVLPDDPASVVNWDVPRIRFPGTDSVQSEWAIQSDPAINITVNAAANAESVALRQLDSWLLQEQRPLTKLALAMRNQDYRAQLRLNRIQPRINAETVTNVLTTRFAVEETMLIDFQIRDAGVRELQFELPSAWRDARINARLVSETVITDVANRNAVLVTLKLQDEVIDGYRVVVEHDRPLTTEQRQVDMPRVISGTTDRRFVTLQNSGRDEIDVSTAAGFEKLNRQRIDFSRLQEKLTGSELTMAYIADNAVPDPVINYQLNAREILETVAASIEFSKTVMMVEPDGAYRSVQVFQVNNRSEQYLELKLPENAVLLSVVVDGELVKPVAVDGPGATVRDVRIPLVKTAEGDLDYPVQIKYSGQLPRFQTLAEISFPVIETGNINVQLSQLQLRLPESYQWMRFGGTMTRVDDAGVLDEGFLSYKSRQIQQLTEQLQSSARQKFNPFSKQRAYQNLEKIKQDLEQYQWQEDSKKGQQLQAALEGNNDQLRAAQQQYELELGDNQQQTRGFVDNRSSFNNLLENQSARISRNSINRANSNFFRQIPAQAEADEELLTRGRTAKPSSGLRAQKFDDSWLTKNKLADLEQGGNQAPADQPASAPSRQLQLDLGQPAFKEGRDQGLSYSQNNDAQVMLVMSPLNAEGQAQPDQTVLGGKLENARRDSSGQITQFGGVEIPNSGRPGMGGYGGGGFGEGEGGGGGGRSRYAPALPGWTPALQPQQAQSATGLTSLDIEFPARGIDYYFKSPRGNATVTAVAIDRQQSGKWTSTGLFIGGAALAWLVLATWLRFSRNSWFRWLIGAVLMVVGLTSLAFSVLPMFGALAILLAVAQWIGLPAATPTDSPRSLTQRS